MSSECSENKKLEKPSSADVWTFDVQGNPADDVIVTSLPPLVDDEDDTGGVPVEFDVEAEDWHASNVDELMSTTTSRTDTVSTSVAIAGSG